MSTSPSKTLPSKPSCLIMRCTFICILTRVAALNLAKLMTPFCPLQVCEWHHLPSLAVHTAHDVHTVPSGQPAADGLGGFQLLLSV